MCFSVLIRLQLLISFSIKSISASACIICYPILSQSGLELWLADALSTLIGNVFNLLAAVNSNSLSDELVLQVQFLHTFLWRA